jgi:hypothetical protein
MVEPCHGLCSHSPGDRHGEPNRPMFRLAVSKLPKAAALARDAVDARTSLTRARRGMPLPRAARTGTACTGICLSRAAEPRPEHTDFGRTYGRVQRAIRLR